MLITSIIWYSLMVIAGFYLRHWSKTGTGQFRRLGDIFGN